MADPVSVSGSKIYIGRKVAFKYPVVLADFSGATWTEITGLTSLGSLGNTQNFVTQSFINLGFDVQFKGTKAGSAMENSFVYDPNDTGQIALRAAIADCSNYEFKLEAGAGCAPSGVVTITIASPGVVTTSGGHGLSIGSPVAITTTGALPTGLTAATTYYVIAAGFTATTYQLAATPGGTAIVTTGTQSGVHTATGQPVGQTALFRALAGEGVTPNGDANTTQLQQYPLAVNSNIVRI